VTVLRDSQNFVRAGEQGISIHEMRVCDVRLDLQRWQGITDWLEGRVATELTSRDLWPFEPRSGAQSSQGAEDDAEFAREKTVSAV
jgi:gamma-glutamyl:cysteine ligase YbdK (ATP-grasp superfamily)